MNILLSISHCDGGDYLAFDMKSLNLELPLHNNINEAIQFVLNNQDRQTQKNASFGEISVYYDEITNDYDLIANVLRAEAEYGDPESEEYDARYTDVTIQPPFHIDAVIKVRSFS